MVKMITARHIEARENNEYGNDYFEFVGLHDDTKPTTDVTTGSLFLELDTGDIYYYDETGAEWKKLGS